MTITVGSTPPPPGPTAGGPPPQDFDGYVFPPGCGGYGCPSARPSSVGPSVTHSLSPLPSHSFSRTPSTAATVGPSPTLGSLAQTGPSDVFVTSVVIGGGMFVLGLLVLLALWRRRRTG